MWTAQESRKEIYQRAAGARHRGSAQLLAMLLMLLVCAGVAEAQQAYKLAVLVPLTGAPAAYGLHSKRGAELAFAQFQKAHPEVRVELQVEDTQGDTPEGVIAATKLLDLKRVIAVVCCVTSGGTLAAAPTMNDQRIPMVSAGGSSPKVVQAGEYVFRTWPGDDSEAAKLAALFASRNIKRLAILRANISYGDSFENTLRKNLAQAGNVTAVTDSQLFEQSAAEMDSQLTHIKTSGPDALLFVGFPESAIAFGKSYSRSQLRVPLYATSVFENPQVATSAGEALGGTVFGKPLSKAPAVVNFAQAYRIAYGVEAGLVSDTSYDATMLILNAMLAVQDQARPVSGEALHDFLKQVKEYSGASGAITLGANGRVVKPIELFILKDKRFQPLAPSSFSAPN